MPQQLFATAGAKLYIAQALNWAGSDFNAASFAGESWLEIPWVENMGSLGDTAQEIKFDAIAQSRTIKFKGSRDAGNMTVIMGLDHTSYAQLAIRAAAADQKNSYAFRIDFNDAATAGTPSKRYFAANVMSAVNQLDGTNNVVRLQAILAIVSNIVSVDAVP